MSLKEFFKALVPSRLVRYNKLKKINKRYNSNGKIQSVEVDEQAQLDCTTEIAREVRIGSHARIGRHTYVQVGTEILSAEIGAFCSIGTSCHIGMYEHPIDNVSTSSRLYLKMLDAKDFYTDIPQPAVIGNDVWIGSNSTILGGVRIGDGAVIGAGAVVTKDVPPYAVVGGVPAKIIKYRFSPEKIEKLLQDKWWEWDDSAIKQNREYFMDK